MADAKDYLELWRERYSFPSYIGDNFRLSEDGTIVLDNEKEWSEAQRILLQGSAVGTSKNSYLDPKPLFNKLGEIYTNIINSSFASARTDSIKMNRNNMDYTNGSGLLVDQTPVYPFFCFLYGMPEETSSKDVYNDWYNENVVIDIISAISENNNIDDSEIPNIINIDSKLLKSKTFPSFVKTQYQNLQTYLEYYTRWYSNADYPSKFSTLFNEDSEDVENFWKKHWYCIRTTNTETSQELEFYLPNEKFVEQFRLFKKKMLDKVRGLQLLMPQYHRRVEVEDLDENFWVISVILDAVVNALWGPYGLIDVVRQLILKVTQIEDFLGLSSLTGIELLYDGKDELYFDMYSRFLLSELQLKLKTQSGERIIKNIFKAHSENSNRPSTTDTYSSRDELFKKIQFKEITPSQPDHKSTGLYDSDLITSETAILKGGGKDNFVSLSTVIDAINNAIVDDKVDFGSIDYTISQAYQDFFSEMDITPDGTLSPTDYQRIASDNSDFIKSAMLTPEQVKRFEGYTKAKQYLENLVSRINTTDESQKLRDDEKELLNNLEITSLEDIEKYFITKKVLVDNSIDIIDSDDSGTIDKEEFLSYSNSQMNQIRGYFNNLIQTFGIYDANNNKISDISDLVIDKEYPIDLSEIQKEENRYKAFENSLETYNKLSNYLSRYCYNSTGKEYIKISQINKEEYCYLPWVLYEKTTSSHKYVMYIVKCNLDDVVKAINAINISDLPLHIPVLNNSEYKYKDPNNIEDIIKMLLYMLNHIDDSSSPSYYDRIKAFAKGYMISRTKNLSVTNIFNDILNLKNLYIHSDQVSTETDYTHTFIQIKDSNYQTCYNYIDIKNPVLEGVYQRQISEQHEKSIKNTFIPINNFDTVGVLPTEDIYTYNLYACIIIARKILPSENDISRWFKKYSSVGDTFFDLIKPNENDVDLFDAIEIARRLLPDSDDAEYFSKIKNLMSLIDNDDASGESFSCVMALAELINAATGFNKINLGDVNESTKNAIKNYLFSKKYDGESDSIKTVSEISCPNLYILIEIAKLAQPERDKDGYIISGADKQTIINTITKTNYQLYDNILVFLYDEDYYNIVEDKNNSNNTGLYVSVTDGFYKTTQPVIKYDIDSKQDTTHCLFVPRSDLIGGEIIELRLTQKGIYKEILDLSQLTSEGFTKMIAGSGLFLSLHNSFADIPAQYNHRTTLFFKDTTPEQIIDSDGKSLFKNVNDWFCNGIECQYFKPTIKKVGEDTKLSTQKTKKTNLKIKASMICKVEDFHDNSFIFEEGPYDDPSTDEVFYSFSRKMAFGAAQRNNLVFYSSPATQDGDMFVHRPSQLLVSPGLRGDESIQPPYWLSNSTYAEKIYAYDVMSRTGNTCKLADITNMLYKNSLIKEKRPLVIEAIWGMRNVDNYIKPKKMKYIIIEREPGSRNNTYGPTSIGFSHSSGYLHDSEGLTSLGEYDHYTDVLQIQWYASDGAPTNSKNSFPPANAKYGVIDLTKLVEKKGSSALQFAQTFMIRFYSSDINNAKTKEEFQTTVKINNKDKTIYRRPIFKMAYFLGEDMSETEFLASSYAGDK